MRVNVCVHVRTMCCCFVSYVYKLNVLLSVGLTKSKSLLYSAVQFLRHSSNVTYCVHNVCTKLDVYRHDHIVFITKW